MTRPTTAMAPPRAFPTAKAWPPRPPHPTAARPSSSATAARGLPPRRWHATFSLPAARPSARGGDVPQRRAGSRRPLLAPIRGDAALRSPELRRHLHGPPPPATARPRTSPTGVAWPHPYRSSDGVSPPRQRQIERYGKRTDRQGAPFPPPWLDPLLSPSRLTSVLSLAPTQQQHVAVAVCMHVELRFVCMLNCDLYACCNCGFADVELDSNFREKFSALDAW